MQNGSRSQALLLKKLENVPDQDRTAQFVSVITCLTEDGSKIVASGTCQGRILRSPRGSGGFGYDPLFYVPEEDATFAELSAEQKNRISHRARALRIFAQEFQKYKENQHADK